VLKRTLREVFSHWETKAAKRMEWRNLVGEVRAGTRRYHRYDDDHDDDDGDDEVSFSGEEGKGFSSAGFLKN